MKAEVIEKTATHKGWIRIGRASESLLWTVVLVFSNFAILADVPILRPLTAFFLITYLPGRLLTQLLLDRITRLESFLMSIAASLAYVMLTTFAIQTIEIQFGISNPLEANMLVLSLDIEIAPLLLMLWLKEPWKADRRVVTVPWRLKFSPNPLEMFLIATGAMLPILGLCGTDSFTRTGDNAILVATIVMTVAYAIFLSASSTRISRNASGICILLFASSLLIMYGMSSRYLMGEDVYVEYYAFKVTRLNEFWSMPAFNSALTASLSTSLLPTAFNSLIQGEDLLVYKLLYPILTAIVPVFSYAIFLRFTKQNVAVMASILVAAQIPFMFLLTHQMRVSIALIITASCLLLVFQSTRFQSGRKMMLLILSAGLVVSYYVTPIIYLAALLSVAILRNAVKGFAANSIVSIKIFVTIAIVHFSWWLFVTGSDVFGYYSRFVASTVRDLVDLFVFSSRGAEVRYILSPGGEWPDYVRKVATQIIIFVLSASMIIELRRASKARSISAFLTIRLLFWILLVAAVVLPFVSIRYGGDRLFTQVFPFISISFATGLAAFVARRRFGKKLLWIPAAFVGVVVLSNTFLLDQVAGIPRSPILNETGRSNDISYVYVEEVAAAKFLIDNAKEDSHVYLDLNPPGTAGLFDLADQDTSRNLVVTGEFFENYTGRESGFLLLRHANVVNGMVYGRTVFSDGTGISRFTFLENCSVVLDSGYARILLL